MERYVDWLKENGATFDAIDWPVEIPDTGRGARATQDVLPNQPFLTIPAKLIIDPPLCRRAPDIGPFLSAHSVFAESDEITIATFLCHERLKGKRSFWDPYIDSLPKDTGSLYNWSKAELDELHDPGLVDEALDIGPQERKKLYKRVTEILQKASGAFKQVTNSETLTFELFAWAYDTVCCRSFGRRIRYVSLVPLADNLNHSNVQTKYSYDGMVFKLFPSGKNIVKKGAEAFNSYGRRSNANLLLCYGFALEENEWDELSLALGLPESSPCADKKRAVMHGPVLAKLRQGRIPYNLLIFFRLNFASVQEFEAFCASNSSPVSWASCEYLNIGNELLALNGSIGELQEILESFPTTEEEDNRELQSNSIPVRKLFAVRYRVGRKRILRMNIEYLQKMKAIVDELAVQLAKEGKKEDPTTIDSFVKARYEGAQTKLMEALETNNSILDLSALFASVL